jgi:predicted NBD/HSP70 family sugar kinase
MTRHPKTIAPERLAAEALRVLREYRIDELVVVDRARRGNVFALRLLARVAATLGIGVATAINLFSPELVILNGRFFDAGDLVLKPLEASIRNRALPNTMRRVAIERSTLGTRASALGAGIVAIEETLKRF